jgi:hypothetical protein
MAFFIEQTLGTVDPITLALDLLVKNGDHLFERPYVHLIGSVRPLLIMGDHVRRMFGIRG